MASRSERLESSPFTERPTHRAGEEGRLTTAEGEREAKSLSPTSLCAAVALLVVGAAGIVFIVLGATNIFGAVGSAGFYASVIAGGSVTVIAAGGLIWIVAIIYKNQKSSSTEEPQKSIPKTYAESINIEFDRLGPAAIEFAQQKLRENPAINPTPLAGPRTGLNDTHQSINPNIFLLVTLFNDYLRKLREALKKHREDPWSHDEVIQAADELMKISYAIGKLTLADLPAFTAKLAEKKISRTYAVALAVQDSSLIRTFYILPSVYRWIRFKTVCNDSGSRLAYPKDEITETEAQPFYQEGTIQSSWRLLYNYYSDDVRAAVPEAELLEADKRHVYWTRKDESSTTFVKEPCPQPSGIWT